ncbi:MAG TPA: YcnI family protein [Baekduia sp.]|uniref:YcnI family protein n=1 Tax=Baekduia sp. TaxID=2600305 RepID=UPI002D77344B|nr:YcnI family protein [Baekduia sp.]HET6510359.1 YcnI family protein [Baekduia sp.]
MNTKRIILSSSLALGLAGASATAADAHVTLQPKTAAAGAYTVEAVRVPNETDDAVTTKVAVQFPEGFASASYQTTPGWSVKVVKEKLATPVKTDDGEITEGVKTITWTASSKATGIAPGEFRDFPISVQIPGKAGDTLTFKALQTYSDGEVVRWIGAPDADRPAPTIAVTAPADDHATAAAGTATTQDTAAPVATPAATSTSDDDSNTLAVIALVVGALGLLAGGAGLASARRRP